MANKGSTFLALLTGAAIGAGVGMLYAPDRGEDTRRRIGDNARRAQDNLNRQYREKSSNLTEQAKRARLDFENRLEDTLSSASYKADEIIDGLEAKLEELRRQNSKFQKSDKKNKSEQVKTPDTSTGTSGSVKPSTDNAIA